MRYFVRVAGKSLVRVFTLREAAEVVFEHLAENHTVQMFRENSQGSIVWELKHATNSGLFVKPDPDPFCDKNLSIREWEKRATRKIERFCVSCVKSNLVDK